MTIRRWHDVSYSAPNSTLAFPQKASTSFPSTPSFPVLTTVFDDPPKKEEEDKEKPKAVTKRITNPYEGETDLTSGREASFKKGGESEGLRKLRRTGSDAGPPVFETAVVSETVPTTVMDELLPQDLGPLVLHTTVVNETVPTMVMDDLLPSNPLPPVLGTPVAGEIVPTMVMDDLHRLSPANSLRTRLLAATRKSSKTTTSEPWNQLCQAFSHT